MSEKRLYSYSALFDTPDKIIHAAKTVAGKGYKKFDVNTPYPVHGMDAAMKLPKSKIGWVTLIFGLTGTLSAVTMMGWMMAVDYPIVIGGKPFFGLPAFGPIMFELSVLLGALATVGALLFFFLKLPNNSHPIHDTEYMKSVASDKYGIFIEADDPNFNLDEINSLFTELGAEKIIPIYYDEEEINFKPKIFDKKFVGFLVVVAIITSLSVYGTMNKLLYIAPFSWMSEQNKSIPQQTSTIFDNGSDMLEPVKGTVARGYLPYKFKDQPEKAAELLVNPLVPTEENLKLGKIKYDIYCSVCHGYLADGKSRLNGNFPEPPTLHSNKVRNWTDGRIYHVIMEGQNVMPSYSHQLSENERWAVINYIRVLQRSFNAKESDLL
jgi:mono/diheme cytochrome c family protein